MPAAMILKMPGWVMRATPPVEGGKVAVPLAPLEAVVVKEVPFDCDPAPDVAEEAETEAEALDKRSAPAVMVTGDIEDARSV